MQLKALEGKSVQVDVEIEDPENAAAGLDGPHSISDISLPLSDAGTNTSLPELPMLDAALLHFDPTSTFGSLGGFTESMKMPMQDMTGTDMLQSTNIELSDLVRADL